MFSWWKRWRARRSVRMAGFRRNEMQMYLKALLERPKQ